MLVDSHCHLDFPEFAPERDQVIARARAAGVGALQTICTRMTKFDQVLAVAEAYLDVWCSVGVHPHNAGEPAEAVDAAGLAERATHPKVIGLGETGLDYYYDHAPREAQKASFQAHIEAAQTTGLPLIVHTRDADDDTVAMLAEGRGATGVIHCFSSDRAMARRCLDLGFYLSLSGIVTFRNAEELREVARMAPLDRLLVETDAPYLAPVPMRGKRNEPAFVAHTAALVAKVRGVPEDELAAATTANFHRLFAKARPRP